MTANELAAEARQLQESGKLQAAWNSIQLALRLDRRCAEAYHVRAHIHRDRGNLRRAIWDFQKADRLNPHDFRNWYCRAVTRRLRKDWRGALRDIDRALGLCSSSVEALHYRGLLHLELGQLEIAAIDFTCALGFDPRHARSHHDRAVAHDRLGRRELAEMGYTRAIELDPTAHAFRNRGWLRHTAGDLAGAAEDWGACLALEPQNRDIAHRRGLALFQLGRFDAAYREFTRATEIDPRFADGYLGRARVWRERGFPVDARRNYELALRLAPPFWKSQGIVRAELRTLESAHS